MTKKSEGIIIDEIAFVKDVKNPCGKVKFFTGVQVGDVIHIFNTFWFEAIVLHFGHQTTSSVIAEYTFDGGQTTAWLEIQVENLTWNLAHSRWEYIQGGVPINP